MKDGAYAKPWIETWIDRMGLIVALNGEERFQQIYQFKVDLNRLNHDMQTQVKEAIRLRFAPTNGNDGCVSGTMAVKEVV